MHLPTNLSQGGYHVTAHKSVDASYKNNRGHVRITVRRA